LPIGVQVMGDLYDDRTTLTFAALAQQAGIAK
jgi:Asp-tRNA(Asn)/Glu-tRNA(Gln) amidotransferase A subunit family amidase